MGFSSGEESFRDDEADSWDWKAEDTLEDELVGGEGLQELQVASCQLLEENMFGLCKCLAFCLQFPRINFFVGQVMRYSLKVTGTTYVPSIYS